MENENGFGWGNESIVENGVGWGWEESDNPEIYWPISIPESYQTRKKLLPAHIGMTHLEDEMFNAGVRVLFSSPEGWTLFRDSLSGIVAIDCEGTSVNQSVQGFPIMIQIAIENFVMIEFVESSNPELSNVLLYLLNDQNIIKVFCDPSGSDIESLQNPCCPMVDIVAMAVSKAKKQSDINIIKNTGLTGILNYITGKNYIKESIRKNGWYTLRTAAAMKQQVDFVNYAAADAWGTYLAYTLLTK